MIKLFRVLKKATSRTHGQRWPTIYKDTIDREIWQKVLQRNIGHTRTRKLYILGWINTDKISEWWNYVGCYMVEKSSLADIISLKQRAYGV